MHLLGVLSILGGLLGVLSTPSSLPVAAADVQHNPDVREAAKHDTSPTLRDMAAKGQLQAPSASGTKKPSHAPGMRPANLGTGSGNDDSIVQEPKKAGANLGVTSGLNFPGLGDGDYTFSVNVTPPDTNGAVGTTQYVQTVNSAFAVWNKANGALAFGPYDINQIFTGFGGGCEANNDGDPIVLFDHMANRWIITQFSVTLPATYHYLQCVAVSTTSDATGAYYRYVFDYGTNFFNDYGKMGIWPDGYYMTYNGFSSDPDAEAAVSYLGVKTCAFNRSAMLVGGTATQQCFGPTASTFGILPSDIDGATMPPAGAPNYQLSFGSNSLNLFKFHVDWANPANSTFTGPTNIPVAAFTPICNGVSRNACVPQPGTTQRLEALSDRLMYRLAYRNFGDHESIVVSHAVTANGVSAERWYELRSPGATPVVYQQGTYGGDSVWRWMGSVAMDHSGNMALGYSVVNGTSVYPGIVYTGRAAGDPLGTMRDENAIQAGSGVQSNYARWGDYSAMSVDPTNDCTFWYTNEYWAVTGNFNWHTRIASFTFPGCGQAGPPPAPTGVHESGSTTTSVSWSWTNPDPSAAIAVTTDGSTVTGLPAGTTSYTKTGIAPGGYACLAVAAYNGAGASWSGWSCGLTTPIAPTVPTADYTLNSASAVRFNWTDGDGVSQIAVTTDGTHFTALGPGTATYTVTGVASGYYACLQVAAYNAEHSAYSPWGCGYTLPTTPNMPTATGHTASSVTFTWTNHDPYSYIALSNGGAVQALGQNQTTYTQTGLSPGQYACIKVAAYNYAGASAYTANWACGQAA